MTRITIRFSTGPDCAAAILAKLRRTYTAYTFTLSTDDNRNWAIETEGYDFNKLHEINGFAKGFSAGVEAAYGV